jgi:hypothetical protein
MEEVIVVVADKIVTEAQRRNVCPKGGLQSFFSTLSVSFCELDELVRIL